MLEKVYNNNKRLETGSNCDRKRSRRPKLTSAAEVKHLGCPAK